MSNCIGVLGSVWLGWSVWGYTTNLIALAFAVVFGFLAWKLFIESLKKDKHGSDKLGR